MTDDTLPSEGGVWISGSTVSTGGGDIVGGSKSVQITSTHLDQVFDPIAAAVRAAPPDKQPEAVKTLSDLKTEAAKGGHAADATIAKLVDKLVDLVPGAVSAVVVAFGSPVLAGLVGPVTSFVLSKLHGK